MKNLILALTILLCASTTLGRMGPVQMAGNTVAATADYTPAQVEFRFGTATTTGNNVKIVIYDNSNNLLCTSSPLAKSGGNTVTGSISGCSALTPGNTYKVVYVGDGYISPSVDTSPTWQVNSVSSSGSYTTPPSTLPTGGNMSFGEIALRVLNSSGVRLLGDADYTDNTYVSDSGVDANMLTYFASGYTCVTL